MTKWHHSVRSSITEMLEATGRQSNSFGHTASLYSFLTLWSRVTAAAAAEKGGCGDSQQYIPRDYRAPLPIIPISSPDTQNSLRLVLLSFPRTMWHCTTEAAILAPWVGQPKSLVPGPQMHHKACLQPFRSKAGLCKDMHWPSCATSQTFRTPIRPV